MGVSITDAGILLANVVWKSFSKESVDEVVAALDALGTPVSHMPFTFYPDGNPYIRGPQRRARSMFTFGAPEYGLFPRDAELSFDRTLTESCGYHSLDLSLSTFKPLLQMRIPFLSEPTILGRDVRPGETRYALLGGETTRLFAFASAGVLQRGRDEDPIVRADHGHLLTPSR